MRRTPVLGSLLALTLGLTAGACSSGESDPDELQDELIEQFQDEPSSFTEAQAECSAEILIDVVGADELEDIDFSDDAPPVELADAFAEAGQQIAADCDIDLGE